MKKLITSVVFGLVGFNSILSQPSVRPRMVVGIMVDQLRTDYVENFREFYGDNGLVRLMQQGVYFKDVDFKVNGLDNASGTALVYTGNYPRYNGVPSEQIYDQSKKDMVSALMDESVIGNFTSETYSPAGLRISTISDEIAVDGKGTSMIFSVSPYPQQAVIMGGHAGNSVVWLNENNGNWASTTYYKDFPQSVSSINYDNPLTARLDTMVWMASDQPKETKKGSKATLPPGSFRHVFSKSDKDVYKMYAASPLVNREVTDIAISYLKEYGPGKKNEVTDMLNVGYTVAPYPGGGSGMEAEMKDSYIRLDRQLKRLFDAIEQYVGLENTLIFLSSTGYFEEDKNTDPSFRIPTGNFSVKRAMSLLNSYLSAQFGNGSYVDTYSNGHVYLDHKEIEEKHLDLHHVAELARDFMVKMSGVNDVFTMSDIMSSTLPSMESVRLSTDPKSGGDLVVEFNPGWNVTDDLHFPQTSENIRSEMVMTPAFIFGVGLKPEVVEETTDAIAIAPTVARVLRIRSPNGAASKPLNLN